MPFHSLMRQSSGLWNSSRCGINFLKLDCIIEFRSGALHLLFAEPIDGDICDDSIDPSIERRLATEIPDGFPRLKEAVLGKVPGVLLVMNHVINHAKNTVAITGYQLVECLGITRLAT